MDKITGIFGDGINSRFDKALADFRKKVAAEEIEAGVVGVITKDGTFMFDWNGIPSSGIGLVDRMKYEIHKWVDSHE